MMVNSSKPSIRSSENKLELQKYQPPHKEIVKTVIISFFYLLVTIIIGIPLWWKTTSPYHAHLPYSEISKLSSRPIEISIPISVLNFHTKLNDNDFNRIKEMFTQFNSEQFTTQHTQIAEKLYINYHVKTKDVSQLEKEACANSLSINRNINQFWSHFEKDLSPYLSSDNMIKQRNSSSIYHFIILPWMNDLRFNGKKSNEHSEMQPFSIIRNSINLNLIYVFLSSTVFSNDNNSEITKLLALHIKYLMDEVLIQTNHLKKLAQRHNNTRSFSPKKADLSPEIINEPLSVSTIYDVTVTVLTSGASQLPEKPTSSELSVWMNKMLTNPIPWLKESVGSAFESWLPFIEVDFYSQRLYGDITELFKKSQLSKTGNYTFYSQDDVSNLINYLESFLGPPQTAYAASRNMTRSNPGLHLILLLNIAKANKSNQSDCTLPLRFHISSSVDITDYALVPQWGGLLSIDASECHPKTDETKMIAQKMIYVIRSILGFPQIKEMGFDQNTNSQAYHIQSSIDLNGKTTNWELSSWFLRRTVECITETKQTIDSIINLLQRLPNMIIRDDVATEVYESFSNWSLTLESLKEFDEIHQSHNSSLCSFGTTFLYAHNALSSANGAFFDHSLLGLCISRMIKSMVYMCPCLYQSVSLYFYQHYGHLKFCSVVKRCKSCS
ncbi:unnamed protein product [Heterobilharzia americana]|nr:unnamed protein product [Heterobilharzia americana]